MWAYLKNKVKKKREERAGRRGRKRHGRKRHGYISGRSTQSSVCVRKCAYMFVCLCVPVGPGEADPLRRSRQVPVRVQVRGVEKGVRGGRGRKMGGEEEEK